MLINRVEEISVSEYDRTIANPEIKVATLLQHVATSKKRKKL